MAYLILTLNYNDWFIIQISFLLQTQTFQATIQWAKPKTLHIVEIYSNGEPPPQKKKKQQQENKKKNKKKKQQQNQFF